MEDIEECSEMDNLCKDNRCSNTFGSFMCTCNDGYKSMKPTLCVLVRSLTGIPVWFLKKIIFILNWHFFLILDIDECAQDPLICGVGTCVNTDVGYHCICPDGYVPLPGVSKSRKFPSSFDWFLIIIWRFYRGMCRHAQGTLLHEFHQQRLRKSHDSAAEWFALVPWVLVGAKTAKNVLNKDPVRYIF